MNDIKDIVIVGSGGFAKEVAFLIDEINSIETKWNMLGYIDEVIGYQNGKYSTFNNDEWLLNIDYEIHVVLGVGNPKLLEKLYFKFKENSNIHFPNLIHPNAIGDWERISLGIGNVICASNTFTTDISIGNFNIINLDCTIGHDSILGSYNVVNPSVNISGGVSVGNNTLLGTGSTILQNVSIHSNAIIGAGATLTKNTTETGIYIGTPAILIKPNK